MFGDSTSVQYNVQGWDGALDFNWGGEAGCPQHSMAINATVNNNRYRKQRSS